MFRFVKKPLREGLKLQFIENFYYSFLVRLLHLQFFEVQFDRNIRLDRGEEFREFNLLLVLFHFFLQRPFQFVGAVE